MRTNRELLEEIDRLKAELLFVTSERNEYEMLSKSWMNDYDKLKEKFISWTDNEA